MAITLQCLLEFGVKKTVAATKTISPDSAIFIEKRRPLGGYKIGCGKKVNFCGEKNNSCSLPHHEGKKYQKHSKIYEQATSNFGYLLC